MKEKRRLRRIGLVCNVITSGPPKPAPCQLSEDIPAISPISTCSVFIHDAIYTPKICRLSVNLHFKEFLSDFIISKIVSRYMMQSTRQKFCRLSVNLDFEEFLSDFIISKIVSPYMMQSTRQKFCRFSKLDFEEFYPSHPRYPRYGTCSDPTCSDHARSMDIRPGVMFQTSRHLVTGLLIRKIVLVSSSDHLRQLYVCPCVCVCVCVSKILHPTCSAYIS